MAFHRTKFERIAARYSKIIGAAVRRVCLHRYDALIPDVTQEVHLALWNAIETGKEIRNPEAYVYRMALTTGLRLVERERKHSEKVGGQAVEGVSSAVDESIVKERARLLNELLGQLQPDESKALRAYLVGYNHVEIARLFGWTESVARHRVYRGIERLRSYARKLEQTDKVAASG